MKKSLFKITTRFKKGYTLVTTIAVLFATSILTASLATFSIYQANTNERYVDHYKPKIEEYNENNSQRNDFIRNYKIILDEYFDDEHEETNINIKLKNHIFGIIDEYFFNNEITEEKTSIDINSNIILNINEEEKTIKLNSNKELEITNADNKYVIDDSNLALSLSISNDNYLYEISFLSKIHYEKEKVIIEEPTEPSEPVDPSNPETNPILLNNEEDNNIEENVDTNKFEIINDDTNKIERKLTKIVRGDNN